MKVEITNFRDLLTVPGKYGIEVKFAVVDVTTTTGFLCFKKVVVEERNVYKDDGCWRWLDTGKWTPDFVVEKLYSAYKAKQLLQEAQELNKQLKSEVLQ